jgi:cytoplasmic FMR1 interacting protein
MSNERDDSGGMQVQENVYLVIVEGFQLLNDWTGRIWEQCAWKFARPAKDAQPYDNTTPITDYEKVLLCK